MATLWVVTSTRSVSWQRALPGPIAQRGTSRTLVPAHASDPFTSLLRHEHLSSTGAVPSRQSQPCTSPGDLFTLPAEKTVTSLCRSPQDTAGQERYRTITTAYYRGAMGFILMYDITNEESFNAVQDWSTQIKTYSWDNAQVILVGNKCDMEDERVVATERGKHLAEQLGFEFFETSAKDNINVKQTFERLVDIICDKMSESLETDPAVATGKQNTRLTDNPPPQQPNCGC